MNIMYNPSNIDIAISNDSWFQEIVTSHYYDVSHFERFEWKSLLRKNVMDPCHSYNLYSPVHNGKCKRKSTRAYQRGLLLMMMLYVVVSPQYISYIWPAISSHHPRFVWSPIESHCMSVALQWNTKFWISFC